jgi:flavin reductase (DIM6/NTAB) family NADH-FMN oxidoreductase RutF
MVVDAADLGATSAYKLLIGSIVSPCYRLVSTVSTEGVANLAPISFFTAVGRKPPLISISLQPRSDGVTLKDTFVNIRDTREFVVDTVALPQAGQMHHSAFEFDTDVDEFEALGLQMEPSEVVRAPRIQVAPISFECVVNRIIPIENSLDHVVWGEVVRFHIRERPLPGAGADRHRRHPSYRPARRRVHPGRQRLHHTARRHGAGLTLEDSGCSDSMSWLPAGLPSTPTRGLPRAPPLPEDHRDDTDRTDRRH